MDGTTSLFQLRITQGSTRFPERPLSGDRFVIGGGSHCQLQLGGDIPFVHSVLTRGTTGWSIEALVPWPLLMVNGQSVRKVQMQPGDSIQIGDIGLSFELAHNTAELLEDLSGPSDQDLPGVAAVAVPPQELTAEELADRLTTAIEEVHAQEQRQRRGWERLLAAAQSVQRPAEQPAPKTPLSGTTLDLLTQEVETLRQREAQLVHTIQQLESRQAHLDAELQALRAALQPTPGPQLRMSA
jgi:hypothetical protein